MQSKKSKETIIGRSREQKILTDLFSSGKAELIALYGRRRIGKTFLIKNFVDQQDCAFFHTTGIQSGRLEEQLEIFAKQIGDVFYGGATLLPKKRWVDAFEDLTKAINGIPKHKCVVIFLDELPWMATPRSNLLKALEYYWNRYWVFDNRIKLIVCGSSTSWIIEKIINNKGGLHNRVTRTIQLDPFRLSETEAFLKNKGIRLERRHILDLYMVLGGVPLYWSFIRKGLSAHQCIDELCFQKGGALVYEFERLFQALFDSPEVYESIVRIVATHHYGISQSDLIKKSKLPNGGNTINRLHQLEKAGFITSIVPYGHSEKGVYYVIEDEYCLFYLQWIEPNLKKISKKEDNAGYWLAQSQNNNWKSWSGYAFESICYKHISQIRKALNIGPGANVGTWRFSPRNKNEQGVQIDLLFDRADHAITICEIKCWNQPFALDKLHAQNVLKKMEVFRKQTRTSKQLFLAMITVNGLKPTIYSEELVMSDTSLDDLFEPVD